MKAGSLKFRDSSELKILISSSYKPKWHNKANWLELVLAMVLPTIQQDWFY